MTNLGDARTKIATRVAAATILQNRAIVTRKGTATLTAGVNRIGLTDLPSAIDQASVRVAGDGPAGARIAGIEFRTDYLVESKDEELSRVRKELESLERGGTALRHDIEELTAGRTLLLEIAKVSAGDLARGYGRKKIEVADLQKVTAWIQGELHTANQNLRAKQQDLEELQKKIGVRRAEADALSSRGSTEVTILDISIETPVPGDFDLTVEYGVDGASWEPVYDIRVATEEKSAEIVYAAMVRQETGEDWNRTLVTLSTAPDAPQDTLPDLEPWYLSAWEPPRRQAPSGSMMRSMASASAPAAQMEAMSGSGGGGPADEEVLRPAEKKKVAAEAQVARVDTIGETVVYRIESPADLPSRDAPKKLTIGVFKLPVDLTYLTVPKRLPEVFTSARIRNETEFQLLPGEVHLFADSEYLGTSSIGALAPGEKTKLSLGVTRTMKVKRELIGREVGSGGVISKDRITRYGYRIKVESAKKTDAKITVKDQLPVPRHEKIKVVEVKYGEGDEPTKKSDLGILEWTFTVPAGKKRTIEFHFAVSHPVDLTVEGELE